MPNSSLAPNSRFGAALGFPGNVTVPAAAITDQLGNLIHTTDNGDGTSYLGGAATGLAYPSAAYNSSNSGASFSTAQFSALAADITVTSFTGGTSPTITFFLDRLGADGVWYRFWVSSAISAAGTYCINVGPGETGTPPTISGITTTNVSAVLSATARFGWTFGGTVSPTAVTFSASVVGRP